MSTLPPPTRMTRAALSGGLHPVKSFFCETVNLVDRRGHHLFVQMAHTISVANLCIARCDRNIRRGQAGAAKDQGLGQDPIAH